MLEVVDGVSGYYMVVLVVLVDEEETVGLVCRRRVGNGVEWCPPASRCSQFFTYIYYTHVYYETIPLFPFTTTVILLCVCVCVSVGKMFDRDNRKKSFLKYKTVLVSIKERTARILYDFLDRFTLTQSFAVTHNIITEQLNSMFDTSVEVSAAYCPHTH